MEVIQVTDLKITVPKEFLKASHLSSKTAVECLQVNKVQVKHTKLLQLPSQLLLI